MGTTEVVATYRATPHVESCSFGACPLVRDGHSSHFVRRSGINPEAMSAYQADGDGNWSGPCDAVAADVPADVRGAARVGLDAYPIDPGDLDRWGSHA